VIADVDEVLRKLLMREIEIKGNQVDIQFDQPKREWSSRLSKPTLNLYLFDLRENLRLRPKDDLGAVMNSSINEVLSRTIVTSLTVFLVCLALFFFGGEVIHDFSFALLVGVVVGTYSSIFVASPIVYEWRKGKKIRIRTKR